VLPDHQQSLTYWEAIILASSFNHDIKLLNADYTVLMLITFQNYTNSHFQLRFYLYFWNIWRCILRM